MDAVVKWEEKAGSRSREGGLSEQKLSVQVREQMRKALSMLSASMAASRRDGWRSAEWDCS